HHDRRRRSRGAAAPVRPRRLLQAGSPAWGSRARGLRAWVGLFERVVARLTRHHLRFRSLVLDAAGNVGAQSLARDHPRAVGRGRRAPAKLALGGQGGARRV
ncbi:MAG: hypothetical protein ACLUNO_07825, partial [Oscillospiraceae bacterium]